MLADYRAAPVPDAVKAALSLLEQVTLNPGSLTADDVRALKARGLTREMAEHALWVGFCFNHIARLADALGWEVLEPEGFAASARSLLAHGYLMPLRTRPRR